MGVVAGKMRRLVAGPEPGERGLEIECWIGQFGPAAERLAVLDFLAAPLCDAGERGGAGVLEDAVEIADIIRRIVFDEGGGLHRGEKRGLDLSRIEATPLDVGKRPARAIDDAGWR